jgi:uncharacterized protein (DUF2126 family)
LCRSTTWTATSGTLRQSAHEAAPGATLTERLRDVFAPAGLLHFGQGKWYPGESLPRWAFTCYWRNDGVSLWRDPALLAAPDRPPGPKGAKDDDARLLAEAIAERLGLDSGHVIAAYEDPLAYLHKERQLRVNVDPEHNTLDDPEERERLRRVFSRGLGRPVGFVLPLARGTGKDGPAWQSGLWMLRGNTSFSFPATPGRLPVAARITAGRTGRRRPGGGLSTPCERGRRSRFRRDRPGFPPATCSGRR